MEQMTTETKQRFEVAEGILLLEDFVFNTKAESSDPTYMFHFKQGRSLKNSAYYAIRKHSAQTPFGVFLTAEALKDAQESLEQIKEATERFNAVQQMAGTGLSLQTNYLFVPAPTDQPVFRRRLKESTVEHLLRMREDFRNGALARIDHATTAYLRLDQYAMGEYASALRAVYDSYTEQRDLLRERLAGGMDPLEAGSLVDVRAINLAVVMFENSP